MAAFSLGYPKIRGSPDINHTKALSDHPLHTTDFHPRSALARSQRCSGSHYCRKQPNALHGQDAQTYLIEQRRRDCYLQSGEGS